MSNLLMTYAMREPSSIIFEEIFIKISNDFHDISFRSIIIDDVDNDDVKWADVVIAVRPQKIHISRLLKIARKHNVITATLLDDDFFAIKGFYLREMYGIRALKQSLRNSDYLITTTEMLLNSNLKKTKNAKGIVMNCAVVDNDVKAPKQNDEECLNIVYYNNISDTSSFDICVTPTFEILSNMLNVPINWYFYHVHPDLTDTPYENDAVYIDKLPLKEFRKSLYNNGFSIGVMPLIENEFNKGKYVNHFFEYSRAGIPGIYSNVEPYSNFIIDGEDGLLCNNTKEEWANAICALIDPVLRNKITSNAQNRLKTEYSIKSIHSALKNDFPDLFIHESKHNRVVGCRFSYLYASFITKLINWCVWRIYKLSMIVSRDKQ